MGVRGGEFAVCPRLWAGILYDETALDAAWDLVKDWTTEERESMRASVPKLAFQTPFRNTTVLELARRMLEIATHGVRARAMLDSAGSSEEGFPGAVG